MDRKEFYVGLLSLGAATDAGPLIAVLNEGEASRHKPNDVTSDEGHLMEHITWE